MNNTNTMTIKQTYKNFQKEYELNLPDIKTVLYDKNCNYWGQFNTKDLYNKNYILHISDDLMSKNRKFIKQVLYHEFTHLWDSLQFLDKSYEDFETIMQSYSEYHAAQIEMVERLNEIEEPITISSNIYHIGILTIESFMKQSFEHILNSTNNMAKTTKKDNFSFDVDDIYHFCGYIIALRQYGIEYKYDLLKITPIFALQCKNVFDCLLMDSIIMEDVYKTYQELERAILNTVFINSIK